MPFPPVVHQLAAACRDAGGRAYVVGGIVRDRVLAELQGREPPPPKDLDIEVHGIEADDLQALLRRLGRVSEVGRSFGVYKLSAGPLGLDVSLPRRDSKAGPGHRGIDVQGDPHMGVVEAARRRDLTINAMLLDPLTGEVLDPHGGRADLAAGKLRAVDDDCFLEDPLRAVRVVQFAGRLGFSVDAGLVALCRKADLHELPAERIWMELEKLLLRSERPSVGLRVGRETAVLPRVLPQVRGWERDAAEVDAAVDRAAAWQPQVGRAPRSLALMLGALLHREAVEDAEAALLHLRVHRSGRYPLRDRVLHAVAHWRELVGADVDDTLLRRLAEDGEVAVVGGVALAASGAVSVEHVLRRAGMLGVLHEPLPALVQGRDLMDLGTPPGPTMGRILADVRHAQLAGRVGNREEALALVRSLLDG
ncbi:MAG: CCA tRNA nucleotidyltransferase [Alphaproteobacteria bacterium]|nr:CCA tRNA nucleotidyltransferase [Alphaproteobacteria bacterium]